MQSRMQQGGREGEGEDSGYWDLVYLLYPEAVEAAGLGLMHELVSSWPFVERTLAVSLLNTLVIICIILVHAGLSQNRSSQGCMAISMDWPILLFI